jgi:hypothetical protein
MRLIHLSPKGNEKQTTTDSQQNRKDVERRGITERLTEERKQIDICACDMCVV